MDLYNGVLVALEVRMIILEIRERGETGGDKIEVIKRQQKHQNKTHRFTRKTPFTSIFQTFMSFYL